MVRDETLKTLKFVSVGLIFEVFKVAPLAGVGRETLEA